MNLKSLSNDVLDSKLLSLVKQEKELMSEILWHIAEVDRRRLYLKMANPNLFSYLTEHLGYSAGSAQLRIDAARLMNDVPDLPEKLESGTGFFGAEVHSSEKRSFPRDQAGSCE